MHIIRSEQPEDIPAIRHVNEVAFETATDRKDGTVPMHGESSLDGDDQSLKFIEALLALVDQGEADDTARLKADRDRLRGEIENLIRSIAAGVPAESIAPAIREREAEIARLDVRLRTPHRAAPNIEKLRAALTQRAEEWRATLRAEPKVARLLLRRFGVGNARGLAHDDGE